MLYSSYRMGKLLFCIVIFIALHVLVVLGIGAIPIEQIPFPLKENPKDYFPTVFYPLAGFDGMHYILIAKSGYGQFQQAFFPLYPLLINLLLKLSFPSSLIGGLLISWTALVFGAGFFLKLAGTLLGSKKKAAWPLIFLLSFPSAFFYTTVYPESLFLLFSSAALYFIFKKNYFFASVFAVLASLTKIQGIFLIIPFFLSVFELKGFTLKKLYEQIIRDYRKMPFILSPLLGFLIYAGYLFVNYGDPLYFYHTQEAFGANRSSQNIILLPQVIFRYIKIFMTSQINFQYWIAVLELSIFLVVFGVLIFELFRLIKNKRLQVNELSVNLYSLSVLILPTLTGTLSSIPRYALLSFGFFIALSKIKNKRMKLVIAAMFAVVQLVLFAFFIKGYFVS